MRGSEGLLVLVLKKTTPKLQQTTKRRRRNHIWCQLVCVFWYPFGHGEKIRGKSPTPKLD
jgi:hypothetical protein